MVEVGPIMVMVAMVTIVAVVRTVVGDKGSRMILLLSSKYLLGHDGHARHHCTGFWNTHGSAIYTGLGIGDWV